MVKLHPIELNVIAALESNSKISLEDLGGIEAVSNDWDTLSNSRLLDEILSIITSSLPETKYSDIKLCDLYIRGISANTEPIAVRETIKLLCKHSARLADSFKSLLNLAGDHGRPAILRRYYLLGAFEIALGNPAKKHSIIAFLLDIEESESPVFLSHAIKILGVSYTLFSNEDLFDKLELLQDKCPEESYYEMGMSWLHKALNSEVRLEVRESFSKAKTYFEEAIDWGRDDAKVFVVILHVINQLETSNGRQAISDLLPELYLWIAANNVWEKPDFEISWNQLRMTEGFYWLKLYEKLTHLLKELETPAWYSPAVIIEDYLLQVYASNRTIFRQTDGKGLDLVLRPMVRESLTEKSAEKVFLLDQWLKQRPDHIHWDIATKLKAEIEQYRSGRSSGNELGTVADDISTTVPSFAELPSDKQEDFALFLIRYKTSLITGTPFSVEKVFNDVCQELKEVEDFKHTGIQYDFQTILHSTFLFLYNRMNATKANNPEASYLFSTHPNPLEADLQMDYYRYIVSMPREGTVSVEISEVASGRADVHFQFTNYFFVTEVKREGRDCSFESLAKKFLGQTMEYSNTSAKLGILLVLDLTSKHTGMSSFENNIKVELRRKPDDNAVRGIVTVRVPGNRVVPSEVKLQSPSTRKSRKTSKDF
jgi:tetratricopeptide (TPR) repeat protein